VVITAAVLPGAVRAQFTVSALITGGTPGTVYDLIGSDCTTADPRPVEVWATGLTGADGTADLVGYAWTGAVADRYWMALDPSPLSRPPGLHGQFAQGQAAPFPAGQVPCALTSASRTLFPRDVQRAHLPVADESLPAARVVWVEAPAPVERLQRVTNGLRHDPGPELLVADLSVATLDEGQQVGGCHGRARFSG
jgi:hypothetical protein